ncbi:MAG: hypothetical protein ACE5EV_00600 [Gaiellales bacterium]
MGRPTIDIDVSCTADCADLLAALEAEGFRGALIEGGDQVWVRVSHGETDPRRLRTEVLDAIDAWVVDRERPLVVTPLDDDSYSVHPPGD